MPFDEILRRSVDALVNDLNSAVQAEREDAARRARDAAESTAAAALAQAQTAAEQRGLVAGREEGLTEGRRQGFHQGRQEGYEAGKRDGFEAGKDAGFESGKAEGYRTGKEEGFRAGQRAGKSEDGPESAAADLATGARLVDALRAIDRARSLSEILDTLATCAGREAPRAAVLLIRDAKLVGWRFVGFGAALEEGTAFEAPLAESGIIEEAVRTQVAIGGASSSTPAPPAFAKASADCERLAIPLAIGGEVMAALYADRGAGEPDPRTARVAWRSALEVLASHAARALEAVTAFRTAQLMSEAASAPKPAGSPASSEGEHAARRYARLLVSEIKLYHGAEVAAGRRERDLATRLGGEITRARALYDQRASAQGPGTANYFEEELVRTLADGDASLL